MIDTHCHLNFPELVNDIDGVLHRAEQAGVSSIIIPSSTAADATTAVNLSKQYGFLYSAVGIHPCEVRSYTEADRITLNQLIGSTKSIVAIGEVGLDYYHFEHLVDDEDISRYKEEQGRLFLEMIDFAKQSHLPLIVHSREAFEDVYSVLKAEQHPAVIHCFTGTLEEAKAYTQIGCMISFTNTITYKKNQALREVVTALPLEYMMIETDAPYLAPEGMRGEVCEPQNVRTVAECIAEVKGISFEEVDRITTENAEEFFNL